MRRLRFFWPMAPGVAVLMTYGATYLAGRVAGPAQRTQSYFAVVRGWSAKWPFAMGKEVPAAFYSAIQPTAPAWVQVEPQIKMLLDPNDMVSRAILVNGDWEPGSQKIVADHLRPGATFIDVGAHIGYYSLKAATVVGPAGHVLSIEPNPETVRVLRQNIAASAAGCARVWPVACSDKPDVLELFAAPEANTGESSLSRANALQAGQAVRSYKVPAVPLDKIVEDSGVSRVDAIKIDVEGAEFLVLKGAQKILDRDHPALLVELCEHQLKTMGTSVAEVTALLRSHGYEQKRRDDDNFEFVAVRN